MPNLQFNNEAEWLSIRDSHVGGSEVAALFNLWRDPSGSEAVRHLFEAVPEGAELLGGLSPHMTGYRLYCQKAGKVMPDDLSEAERVRAGQFLEPAIASWAKDKWKWKLNKSRVYTVHPEVKGWGASLDYFSQEPGQPPVDVKNVDALIFRDQWEITGGEIEKIPLHIVLQLQHQMGARGAGATESWVLACVGGNRLERGKVHRHEPTQKKIRDAITAFWGAVELGIEPADLDYATVSELYAFGDKGLPPVDLVGHEPANRAARRFYRWSAHLKRVEAHVDRMKATIGNYMTGSTKAVFDDLEASWPVTTRQAGTISYEVSEKTYRMGLTVKPKKAPKPTKAA